MSPGCPGGAVSWAGAAVLPTVLSRDSGCLTGLICYSLRRASVCSLLRASAQVGERGRGAERRRAEEKQSHCPASPPLPQPRPRQGPRVSWSSRQVPLDPACGRRAQVWSQDIGLCRQAPPRPSFAVWPGGTPACLWALEETSLFTPPSRGLSSEMEAVAVCPLGPGLLTFAHERSLLARPSVPFAWPRFPAEDLAWALRGPSGGSSLSIRALSLEQASKCSGLGICLVRGTCKSVSRPPSFPVCSPRPPQSPPPWGLQQSQRLVHARV